MPLWLDNLFLQTVDALYALRPTERPSAAQLRACRVISHRGERPTRSVTENTIEAFDALRGSGVFGIEFDVRWTRDLVPVVFHDKDLLRLYGERARIRDLDWAELSSRHPGIPDLDGFVRRYAGEFHLMAELKAEPYDDPQLRSRRLLEALEPALQGGRCHFLSLSPALLEALPGIPRELTIGIARLNVEPISSEALAAGRAGIAGHYAAVSEDHIRRHHGAGQAVGCGFPRSRAVLFREIGRGVDYVFTNQALRVDRWRREALEVGNNLS